MNTFFIALLLAVQMMDLTNFAKQKHLDRINKGKKPERRLAATDMFKDSKLTHKAHVLRLEIDNMNDKIKQVRCDLIS